MSQVVGLPNNSYKPITNTAWVRHRLCELQKGCTQLAAASYKVYQMLTHGRWFSSGTPASSTTKTGRHDIAEILLKVALSTINQINQCNSISLFSVDCVIRLLLLHYRRRKWSRSMKPDLAFYFMTLYFKWSRPVCQLKKYCMSIREIPYVNWRSTACQLQKQCMSVGEVLYVNCRSIVYQLEKYCMSIVEVLYVNQRSTVCQLQKYCLSIREILYVSWRSTVCQLEK